jgi:hypothetical protein
MLDLLAISDRLSVTDVPSGTTLRPSPERIRRELKRQGANRRRAIRMLADQARETCLVIEAAEQSPCHRQGGIR